MGPGKEKAVLCLGDTLKNRFRIEICRGFDDFHAFGQGFIQHNFDLFGIGAVFHFQIHYLEFALHAHAQRLGDGQL